MKEVTPEPIMQAAFSFAPNRILSAAVQLGVFNHISEGRHGAAEIAEAAGSSPRGTEILLNALCALDYLTKSDGEYRLAPISEEFLVKGKPAYHGGLLEHSDDLFNAWSNLADVVKTGAPAIKLDQEEGKAYFAEKLVAHLFMTSYPAARVAAGTLGVGETLKDLAVLDVAAGSGAWSLAFAERDPGTKVTAHDYPEVLEVTKRFVDRLNCAGQYSYLPGPLAKVDFGSGRYDLVILGHICHSEGADRSRALLARTYQALKPGGKVLIADMIPDDERKKEVFALIFAVNMLVHTTEGNTFTMKEYREWLKDAGFQEVTTLTIPGPSPLVVGIK